MNKYTCYTLKLEMDLQVLKSLPNRPMKMLLLFTNICKFDCLGILIE